MEPNDNQAEDQEDEQGDPANIRQELQLPRADNDRPPLEQDKEEEVDVDQFIQRFREQLERKWSEARRRALGRLLYLDIFGWVTMTLNPELPGQRLSIMSCIQLFT